MSKATQPAPIEIELNEYFEGCTDLFCILDLKGNFLHVNPAWKTTLGYESSEMVGRHFKYFVHPDDLIVSNEKFEDPDPPDRGQFRNRYRHKQGHYVTLLWSGHYDNKRANVYAHARDVTKEALRSALLRSVAAIQEAYLNNENQPLNFFRQVLKEVIRVAEADGGFITERLDIAKPGKPGRKPYTITEKFELQSIESILADSSTDDSVVTLPLTYLGTTVASLGLKRRNQLDLDKSVIDNLKPVIEAASSVIGLFQASRREQELRERFLVIVENLPLMLTEFGPDSRVTWANRYYREKIGWTESDILSRDVVSDTVGTPEGDTDEPERAREFMLSGRTEWQDFTIKNSNGEWFPSTWTNVRLSDGRSIGIGKDLTDRQAAEAKMIQSSKMASLGEMSAGVSHEINNPLTIIQGSAFRAIQNLLDVASTSGTAAKDEIEGDLNRIIQNCDRIARIVRGLRAFSRTDEHEPLMPTQLSTVIDDVLNLAAERFRSHSIELLVDVDATVVLDCRPVLLGQVLMNLLNNAFDAVTDSKRAPKTVCIKAKTSADQVDIVVEDNGPGISSTIQSRVLDPFFTTKDVGKGTGLGLSISKGIIDSHSGKLLFETSPSGTRFIVQLPIRQRVNEGL